MARVNYAAGFASVGLCVVMFFKRKDYVEVRYAVVGLISVCTEVYDNEWVI